VTTYLENREMSEISVRITEKILPGKIAQKFPKNFINRLFSITQLVLYASYFMLFTAEFCLIVF